MTEPYAGEIGDEEAPFFAVVGMAGRFPGAPDLRAFWDNLVAGRESVRFFSDDELRAAGVPEARLSDPSFVPARAPMADADCFDAAFFGISAREAALTDPQHRVFLECAHAALEDAGYVPGRVEADIGGAVGVFGGCSANTYLTHNLAGLPRDFGTLAGTQAIFANDKDYLATRVSYKLGLTGPSLTVLTACSTALAAVHHATNSLLLGQSDVALAGGVSVSPPLAGGHQHAPGMIYSVDGHCRPFDHRATGTFVGDGVGIVVLRRLEDALADGDCIRAVIRGVALNNDGGAKVGYTAPSVTGQARVIAEALALAEVGPETIGYLEAHGTATPMGDPVEVAAATQAWREGTRRRGYCALGSVKSNVGHLNAAAGAAGLIKVVLSLEHGLIPPSLNFEAPNPALQLDESPFFVVTEPTPWPELGGPRRAAVSAFGAGGTNAHAVLEAAPPRSAGAPEPLAEPAVLAVSARTPAAADAACERLAAALSRTDAPALADVAWTLARGRAEHPVRRAVVASTVDEAAAALLDPARLAVGAAPTDRRPICFVFPAQGAQHPDMGRAIYRADRAFREAMDDALEALRPWVPDLRAVMYPEAEPDPRLDDQFYAGAALFALGWAAAACWRARGIAPDMVLGHSTGEYVAAAVAGSLSLEAAAALFMGRAEAFRLAPPSAMLQVPLTEAELAPRLVDGAWLALVNAPGVCVVSGTPDGISALEAALASEGIESRRLRVSVPAHCPLLEEAAAAFEAAALRASPRPPAVPFLSGVTGGFLSDDEASDPRYWVRHMLTPVRLMDAAAALRGAAGGPPILIELGPHRSVVGLLQLSAPELPAVHTLGQGDALVRLRLGRARLWAEGAAALPVPPAGRREPLPTYPFARRRHWIEPPAARAERAGLAHLADRADEPAEASRLRRHPRPELPGPYVAPRGAAEAAVADIAAEVLGLDRVGVEDGFIDLGADSLITLRLRHEVEQRLGQRLPPGAAFGAMSVAGIARFLDDDALGQSTAASTKRTAPSEPAALVPLRATGGRPPLFLAHPAAGVIFPYFELVRELGPDQPVYAFQALGLDGETPPDTTVEAMASRYIREMKLVQPEGPYRIGGFSFGCYISYEMARQLHADGEETCFLGLMDELAPIDGVRPGATHLARLMFGHNGRVFLQHLHDYLYLSGEDRPSAGARSRLRASLGRGLRGARGGGWRQFVERSAMSALAPEGSDFLTLGAGGALSTMFDLFVLHLRETVRYSPPPFDGAATVFTSRFWYDRPFFHKEERPGLGWGLLLERGVESRAMAGDHLEMVRQPHVAELARLVRDALDEVTER